MKQTIRLTESDLKQMIAVSLKNILTENARNERKKKADIFTNKILNEVTNRLKKGNKKRINEEYYPEDDDMMDDYYYGTMMTFSIEGISQFDDDKMTEEVIQNLTNTNEEYCENSNHYMVLV